MANSLRGLINSPRGQRSPSYSTALTHHCGLNSSVPVWNAHLHSLSSTRYFYSVPDTYDIALWTTPTVLWLISSIHFQDASVYAPPSKSRCFREMMFTLIPWLVDLCNSSSDWLGDVHKYSYEANGTPHSIAQTHKFTTIRQNVSKSLFSSWRKPIQPTYSQER